MAYSAENVDAFRLQCTEKCLVWACIARNSLATRSCLIRNISDYEECVRLTVEDPNNSFFLLTGEKLKRDDKIVLKTNEKIEITVALHPAVCGPLIAALSITRVKKDLRKKKINLFGFGGKGNLRLGSLLFDCIPPLPGLKPICNICLLDCKTLSAKINCRNVGDCDLYYLISQKAGVSCMEVLPHVGTCPAESEIDISVAYTGDWKHMKHLLDDNCYSEIRLTTLIIFYGDEPSRLRMSGLYKKYGENCTDENLMLCMRKLRFLEEAFFDQKQSAYKFMSSFDDQLKILDYLLEESFHMTYIDVVVSRGALENYNTDFKGSDLFGINFTSTQTKAKSNGKIDLKNLSLKPDMETLRKRHPKDGVYSENYFHIFRECSVGGVTSREVIVKNRTDKSVIIRVERLSDSFSTRRREARLEAGRDLVIKVDFTPCCPRSYYSKLVLSVDRTQLIHHMLFGRARITPTPHISQTLPVKLSW